MMIPVENKGENIQYNLPGGQSGGSVISFKNIHTNKPINSTSKNYPKKVIRNVLKVNYKESHSILYNSKHLKII